MAAWPASLPQSPLAGTFQTVPEATAAVFEPDVGPPRVRRRTSNAGHDMRASFAMTEAQYSTLLTFWKTTLSDGVASFTWLHPVDGTVESFAFAGRPPQIQHRTKNALVVQVALYQEPA